MESRRMKGWGRLRQRRWVTSFPLNKTNEVNGSHVLQVTYLTLSSCVDSSVLYGGREVLKDDNVTEVSVHVNEGQQDFFFRLLLFWAPFFFSSHPVELNLMPGIYVKPSREAWWNTEGGRLRGRDWNTGRRRDSERLEVGLASVHLLNECFPSRSAAPLSIFLQFTTAGRQRGQYARIRLYTCLYAALPCLIFS